LPDHFHFICLLLLVLQTALILLLVSKNRRRMRGTAGAKQRYAEATHEARLSVVGEISASIVHEVTQPLSAILNNIETVELLLRAPNPKVTAILDILTDVKHDDLRAHDIVKRLRSFLRKRELTPERCDINELVSGVLTLVLPDAIRRGVAIHTSLDPEVPTLIADPVHLQQVLINLLVNGMEAMQDVAPAERWMAIRTALQDDGLVRVEVQDNGRGVRLQDQARLFEPFFTTKTDGMGLGLSLARSIVTLHGGSIWLADSASRGATFVITLPVNGSLWLRRAGPADGRSVTLH
jgi:signal transduction histidine kinase